MQNLVPVEFDNEAALRAIVARKPLSRRQRLIEALTSIVNRYQDYATNVLELSAIALSTFHDDLAEDCKSFYSSEPEELANLKKLIFESQPAILRSVCQYCSLNEPNTFDHYASKGRFPEFSMFSLNLIPCCGKCNTDKGEQWVEKGHRHFVNLYYDNFIRQPLLKAELRFDLSGEMAIKFMFEKPPAVTDIQIAIIRSHFYELNLHDRHTERAIGVISEARSTIRRLDLRLGQIKQILSVEAEAKADLLGQNYWQAAVYRCLADSDQFIEECLGEAWLPRACGEVVYLLSQPVSAATDQALRRLVVTRARRRYVIQGSVEGNCWAAWFHARAELGLPSERFV